MKKLKIKKNEKLFFLILKNEKLIKIKNEEKNKK